MHQHVPAHQGRRPQAEGGGAERCRVGGSSASGRRIVKGIRANDGATITKLPSDATVRRGEFSLDAAISLLRRRRYSSTCCRYLWSDSSPVARHDWVWMQCHEIEHSNLVSTCRAVHDLIRLVRSFADIQAQWPQFDVDGVEAEDAWKPLLKEMLNIREYVYSPAAVTSGLQSSLSSSPCSLLPLPRSTSSFFTPPCPSILIPGFRGLAHKVAAVLHMLHLDTPTGADLSEVTDSIVSHTSDLGVESAMPDFRVTDPALEELLPSWITRESLVNDGLCQEQSSDGELCGDGLDVLDSGSALPAPAPAPPTVQVRGPRRVMNDAFPVYGLQHCVDVALADVQRQLVWWPEFWKRLKNIEALLRMQERRRRFL